MIDPRSAFQRSVFTSGRGHAYFAQTPGLPLSLKSMSNGRALYRVDRGEFAVDDAGYLILNDRRPYSIEIASPTQVETFVLWFPDGWAEEVSAGLSRPNERLLDKPGHREIHTGFFERYTPHDKRVSPKIRALRRAFKSDEVVEDIWLEERLRELLAAMLQTQDTVTRQIQLLPAVRASTRAELWRRVNRARDFLHAHLGSAIGLSEVAAAACLSPFHLLRTFQAAFGQTPHQYLQECRLERARFLLEKTRIPVTAICLDCGFTSLGSFSTFFQKECGMSPRQWRLRRGQVMEENSKIREVYLGGPR
jgi:AraC family transcriptional regulator